MAVTNILTSCCTVEIGMTLCACIKERAATASEQG